ncbi:nitroreductase family protein [Streptomyces sp. NPDC093060]|uniref:nitroreductase family protein n=1 Tax=Streptomyces sp. NPDC093060 TaxID=3366019 RepID=UPI0037F2A0E3
MANSKLISAEEMRRAVAQDPQFNAPLRPALCRGLVVVPFDGGILVEGGPTRQILRGTATRDLIARLLPLLDGTRDLEGVAEQAAMPVQHVEQVVALLYTCGLLEEGADADAIEADAPSAVFWSRSLDSTRVNRSTAEAMHRLHGTQVAVVADGDLGVRLRHSLLSNGFAQVELVAGRPGSAADLVVAIDEDGHTDLTEASRWCSTRGIPMLPVHLDGVTLDVGPYIDAEFTVSFDEADRQRRAEPPAPGQDRTADETAVRTMATALIAGQVTAIASRVGAVSVLRGMVRTDLESWRQNMYVTAPVPDRTDSRSALTAADVPLALAFEASVAFPPRKLLNPRDHQMHYKPGNLALQHESKRWPSARKIDLPRTGIHPQAPLEPAGNTAAGQVDLSHLASLLLLAAGRQEESTPGRPSVPRWAPTGGNLGSVNLHAMVRDVTGLPSGIWGYESAAHRLAQLSGATDLAPVASTDAAATLVLTGSLARVASKYSTFAWRIVHLDAGVAVAQLCHVARSFGLTAQPLDRWDDLALADALDLDLDAEPITGVLELRPSTTHEA